MPLYRYLITNAEGKQQGELVASDEQAARQELISQGEITILELTISDQTTAEESNKSTSKLSRNESEELAAHLSELTAGGVPLEDGLRVLGNEMLRFSIFGGRRVRSQLNHLAARLERGESLDEAVAAHGAPADLVAVIRSGMQTGNTGGALMQYVTYVKSLSSLRGRILLSFFYPALLLSLGTSLFIGLMVFIIPSFSDVFNGFEIEVPFNTRVILAISWFITTYGKWVFIGVAAVIVFLLGVSLLLSKYARRMIQLRVPFFGRILQMISMARFTHALGFLTENEVPMVESIALSGKSSGDAVIEYATSLWVRRLETGEALSDAIGELPGMHVDLLQAVQWESDSRLLSRALHALGEMYEGRARIETAKIIAMAEPLVALGTGLIFGFTVVALFLPLIQLMNWLS